MPVFYNYTENGVVYSFDDVFVPADAFRSGNLWAWGRNVDAAIGDNTTTQRITPVTTLLGGANWKQIATGFHNTSAIATDGTLWAWGRNGNGQLGDNTTTRRSIPVTTFAGGTNWKQVSSGGYSTSAIKTDGTLWIWGINTNGELGNNTTTQRLTPVTTFAGGTNWKQVSGGQFHTAAIKTDGTLWVWGLNTTGQIGINATGRASTPVTTFAGGTNWKQVAAGHSFTAATKTDGTLWTWGANSSGQLGNNTVNNELTPVTTFAGGTNWKQVSCGGYYTAAIKTDGTLWSWGSNGSGQIGNNTTAQRNTPVTTFAGGTNWKQVSCGRQHTTAIKTNGTLWAWGANSYGRLGDNGGAQRNTPITTFLGGTEWKQVAGGGYHTAAITYIDDYQ
jgi:alpha-tubulin suppressor-like RCC1 family protein